MANVLQSLLQRNPALYRLPVRHTFLIERLCSSSSKENEVSPPKESKLGGFAQAFEKYTAPAVKQKEPEDSQTFSSLMRNSKFIDLGDPEGKTVTGKIFHVVDDDLYIDFGWKFHVVCPRPNKNKGEYVRGARVRLRIKELELSTRFLGANKDLTLMEADATLLGIAYSPARNLSSKPDSVE